MSNQCIEIGSAKIKCLLCDMGASIASVRVQNIRGEFTEVALPVASFESGQGDPSHAGQTIGPCCGRVKNGEIRVGDRAYQLTRNEGLNHLHGGNDGCAARRWTVEEVSPAHVRFSLQLPDGLDGYPGNRRMFADYTVDEDSLRVVYSATTDAATWLDLTNHAYWDLSGRFDDSAMDQTLEIAASRVIYNDASHLPVAIVETDEAMDFSAPCTLSGKMAAWPDHPQLKNARGFNNAYVLDPALERSMGCAARLYAPYSGIRMTMTTDQPAIVLYSGGYLGERTRLNAQPGVASPGCAIAMEAQSIPDPFHLPGVKPDLLLPGEVYRHAISWSFDLQSPDIKPSQGNIIS